MRALSMDLRERVLADSDAGMSTDEVSRKYRVSSAWVRRLKQRRRECGEIAPRPPRNRRVPVLSLHYERLRELLREEPDLTLAELRERLGVAVALSTLWVAVRHLGLTVKKKSSGPASRIGPMSATLEKPGVSANRSSTRGRSSSSTRPGPAPT